MSAPLRGRWSCYTARNAGLQKALFCWVFRLGRATGGEGGTLRHFGTIRLFSWKNQQIRRFRGIHCGLQSGLHFECRNPVCRSMRSMWPGPIASARLAFASSLIRSVIRGVPGWASKASGAACGSQRLQRSGGTSAFPRPRGVRVEIRIPSLNHAESLEAVSGLLAAWRQSSPRRLGPNGEEFDSLQLEPVDIAG
jgi:hypothetical protein